MYSHAVAHIVAVRIVVCRAPFVPYDVLAEMPFLHLDSVLYNWWVLARIFFSLFVFLVARSHSLLEFHHYIHSYNSCNSLSSALFSSSLSAQAEGLHSNSGTPYSSPAAQQATNWATPHPPTEPRRTHQLSHAAPTNWATPQIRLQKE